MKTRPKEVFKPYSEGLRSLLEDIGLGKIALPEFQRDWIWDPDNVKELLISVIQAFPAGSLLLLRYAERIFQFRYFSGTNKDSTSNRTPEYLVLDGQQRLTALNMSIFTNNGVVWEGKSHFFYLSLFDLWKELSLDDVLFHVDERRKLIIEGNILKYDVSTREKEFEHGCVPLNSIYDINGRYDDWKDDFIDYQVERDNYTREELKEKMRKIYDRYIEPIKTYRFPIVELHQETPLPAVCHIFEKVNTAGVKLTVFELLTAILWAQRIDLRKKWGDTQAKLKTLQNLEHITIDAIPFLQSLSLITTYKKKRSHPEKRIAVSCKRNDLLNITAEDIGEFWDITFEGFRKAAKIIYENGIYADWIVPYTTMLAPLASICVQIILDYGDIKTDEIYTKIKTWFWCSVFTWRYSSGAETKSAYDFEQIIDWLRDDISLPDVVRYFQFNDEILEEIASVRNAVYRGILCLILKNRPFDFKSGFAISTQIFYDERIDDHHVFPKKYLESNTNLAYRQINCILNRVLIDASTNRSIGANSPSTYLLDLEQNLKAKSISEVLESQYLNEELMRKAPPATYSDSEKQELEYLYREFLKDRKQKIMRLIYDATGTEQ